MKVNISLYKYQKENDELKKQNQNLRDQLEKYRPKETEDMTWALIDLLDLQRKRIESLEIGIFIFYYKIKNYQN